MQIVIAYKYIALPSQRGQDSVVRLEAGAKNERALFAGKRGEFALEVGVQIESSIQNSRTLQLVPYRRSASTAASLTFGCVVRSR